MANTAQAVLNKAASQIGKNGSTYNLWYWGSNNGAAWCDAFASWCAAQVGATDIVGKYAYTPSHKQFFVNKKQWISDKTKPKPGDLVFFNWGGRPAGTPEHVGLVVSYNATSKVLTTIEGNSNGTNTSSTVMKRTRGLGNVVGYGRPKYATPTPAPAPKPAPTQYCVQLIHASRSKAQNRGAKWRADRKAVASNRCGLLLNKRDKTDFHDGLQNILDYVAINTVDMFGTDAGYDVVAEHCDVPYSDKEALAWAKANGVAEARQKCGQKPAKKYVDQAAVNKKSGKTGDDINATYLALRAIIDGKDAALSAFPM